MKTGIMIFLLIISVNGYSQTPLSLSEVTDVQGINKDELFIRGREWFNENFKNSKAVLQIQDKETGELVGKGVMDVTYIYHYMGERKATVPVNFQMSVWVKDGKFKYEMTNFFVPESPGNVEFGLLTNSDETNKKISGFSEKKMNEMFLSVKQGTEKMANQMIDDLKSKMTKSAKSTGW